MKITFLFGGAVTAKQQAVVDAEIKAGNETEIISNVNASTDFDLLVYGAGFGGLGGVANAVSFYDYTPNEPVVEPVVKKKKSRKLTTAAQSVSN